LGASWRHAWAELYRARASCAVILSSGDYPTRSRLFQVSTTAPSAALTRRGESIEPIWIITPAQDSERLVSAITIWLGCAAKSRNPDLQVRRLWIFRGERGPNSHLAHYVHNGVFWARGESSRTRCFAVMPSNAGGVIPSTACSRSMPRPTPPTRTRQEDLRSFAAPTLTSVCRPRS